MLGGVFAQRSETGLQMFLWHWMSLTSGDYLSCGGVEARQGYVGGSSQVSRREVIAMFRMPPRNLILIFCACRFTLQGICRAESRECLHSLCGKISMEQYEIRLHFAIYDMEMQKLPSTITSVCMTYIVNIQTSLMWKVYCSAYNNMFFFSQVGCNSLLSVPILIHLYSLLLHSNVKKEEEAYPHDKYFLSYELPCYQRDDILHQ